MKLQIVDIPFDEESVDLAMAAAEGVCIPVPRGLRVIGVFCNHVKESVLKANGSPKVSTVYVATVEFDAEAPAEWACFMFFRVGVQYEVDDPNHHATWLNPSAQEARRFLYRVAIPPEKLARLNIETPPEEQPEFRYLFRGQQQGRRPVGGEDPRGEHPPASPLVP